VAKQRRILTTRIISFTKEANQYLGEDFIDSIYDTEVVVLDEDVSADDDTGNTDITDADPEHQQLPFPSAVPQTYITALAVEHRVSITELRETELRIRHGHSNDALDQVRTAVIHLSWQYKNKVRKATSVAQSTHSFDKVKVLNRTWRLQRRVYNHNRSVMMKLGNRTAVGIEYPFLELADCKISTTISDPNSAGQSSDRLPWFWSSSAHVTETDSSEADYENECMSFISQFNLKTELGLVYRVNWLRARAQNNRWDEELNLTKHEMQWTVRWYVNRAEAWRVRRDAAGQLSRGHMAYAEKQMEMWNNLARVSDQMFSNISNDHLTGWHLVA